MANDERGGDELFEDLDKFFAPIRDVDWDEPEEPAATSAGRGARRRPHRTDPTPIQLPEDAGAPERRIRRRRGRLVRHRPARGDRRDPRRAGARRPTRPEEVIAVDDRSRSTTIRRSRRSDSVSIRRSRSTSWHRRSSCVRRPTEELEAAADHFAGSLPRDETYPTEPVDVLDSPQEPYDSSGEDILSELGADDVEEELLSDLDEPSTPRTVVVGGEGISGPSWQEPAAVEVGADIDRRRPVGRPRRTGRVHDRALLAGVAVVRCGRARVLRGVRGAARAGRAGRAVRGDGEAPLPAGRADRTRGRRADDGRRLLAGRSRHPCDVRARRVGRVPVVHDRPARPTHERRARPRADGAQHGVDPAARRVPDRDA